MNMIAKFDGRCKACGGEDGSVFTIHVDAPDGKIWSDGAVSSMRIEARPTTFADHAALVDATRQARELFKGAEVIEIL